MGLISRVSSRTYRKPHSDLKNIETRKMPRGRPKKPEIAAAKKAEEERIANMTQEEIQAEKDQAIEARAVEKAKKAQEKAERQAIFEAAAKAQREKVKNMSDAERKKFYAKNAER